MCCHQNLKVEDVTRSMITSCVKHAMPGVYRNWQPRWQLICRYVVTLSLPISSDLYVLILTRSHLKSVLLPDQITVIGNKMSFQTSRSANVENCGSNSRLVVDFKWSSSGWQIKENCHVLANQFHGNFRSKTISCRKIKSVFRYVIL